MRDVVINIEEADARIALDARRRVEEWMNGPEMSGRAAEITRELSLLWAPDETPSETPGTAPPEPEVAV